MSRAGSEGTDLFVIWVVVEIVVPFWIPIIIRHLIFRVPKKGTIILTITHMNTGSCSSLV